MRKSWREIQLAEGFASVGATQTTYKREMARRRLSASDLSKLTAQEILERRDTTTRIAVGQLIEAQRAGDTSGMAAMLREIRQNDAETAKMLGLYEPAQVDVSVTAAPAAEIVASARERLFAALAQRERPPVIDAEIA